MPKMTMLIGLPAVGKSTWRANNVTYQHVVSSDDLLEEIARQQGKTYDEVFKDNIKWADKSVKETFKEALRKGFDIVVDRTNLSEKARRFWIQEAEACGYEIEAIVFARPKTQKAQKEWANRLAGREGKQIPVNVLMNMYEQAQNPVEEFENITHIDTFEEKENA